MRKREGDRRETNLDEKDLFSFGHLFHLIGRPLETITIDFAQPLIRLTIRIQIVERQTKFIEDFLQFHFEARTNGESSSK